MEELVFEVLEKFGIVGLSALWSAIMYKFMKYVYDTQRADRKEANFVIADNTKAINELINLIQNKL